LLVTGHSSLVTALRVVLELRRLYTWEPAYFYTLMLSLPEYDTLAEQQQLLARYKLRQKEAERTGGNVLRADEPGDIEPGITYRSEKWLQA
jgi:hypothetical protein